MKLKNSDKVILLGLLGIAICALSIIYIAKPTFEKRKAIVDESAQLEVRLRELQDKEAHREEYEQGIIEYNAEYEKLLSLFPADLKQEITIMFLAGIKESNEFDISSLGLGEKTLFYELGKNGADEVITNTADTATDDATATDATAADAATDDAAAGDATATEAEVADESEELNCYSADFDITYSGSYKSLKDVITYIDNYSDRMTVDSLNITYDGEQYKGDLDLRCYSVEGLSRPERSLELSQVEIGIDNIFVGGNGASAGTSLNKYDDKDGAEIETSYDFYTMLNPSTSDVSAKVVGQNGTGKENTVISNSDNSTSTIVYEFYEVDGKTYCKYTLDNDQSYEAEVTSADDVKVLIQSSERKNEEDKVAVKISINNKASIPVYVKVSGDDTVSPRVTITKTGSVKVYQ